MVGAAQRQSNGSDGSMADFQELNLLGEGAFSCVYKVRRLVDGEVYALKKVKLPSLSDKEKQNALNEIRLLASVRHENVISYKDAFFDDKTRCLCIVTECADSGDLLAQIQKCQKEKSHIPEADIWRYLIGLCHGLQTLHGMRILHRDMKSANVFLNSSPKGIVAKLGDFNVSTVAKRGLCMTQTGTPYYASPEVWRDMPYDGKSDIWSLGCVIYEAVALKPPFQAKDMEGLYRRVLRGKYPRIPTHYSEELSDTIGALLQVNPRLRPSADQLLQIPAVQRRAAELGLQQLVPCGASDLLQTIKVPRNIVDLSAYMPRPQYDDLLSNIPEATNSEGYDFKSKSKCPTPVSGKVVDSLDAYMQKAEKVSEVPSLPPLNVKGGTPDRRAKPTRHRSQPAPKKRDVVDDARERPAAQHEQHSGVKEPRRRMANIARHQYEADVKPMAKPAAANEKQRVVLPRILSTPGRLPAI